MRKEETDGKWMVFLWILLRESPFRVSSRKHVSQGANFTNILQADFLHLSA